ncbi:MAG: PLP-dependent aminotransferase family protein [Myxococcota bacterium]
MDTTLRLDDGDQPLFLRIADAVVREIRRGRLRTGDPLPGTRKVADQLGVHRNTVIAAWAELRAQGWLEVRARGATRIAPLPDEPTRRVHGAASGPTGRCGFDVPTAPPTETAEAHPPGTLILAGGRPDLRLLPYAEIARAWRAAVRTTRGRVLDYGDPRGHLRLRAALASVLAAHRGLALDADDVVVTRGAQQALYLVAHALIRPGDRVAVERFGYPPAWTALRSAGAQLVPIDVDQDGLVVEQVEREARRGGLRAVYSTPHHQYPTMGTLPAARRLALLAVAERHRIAIVEDDYDNEYHYRGRPVLPLASLDRAGTVVYVGTLSKTLAPGLRLGMVTGPRPLLDAIVARRVAVDRQGDLASELAVATLIEDGVYSRHLRRTRTVYAERQVVLADLLRRHLGERVAFDVPMGGLALWVRFDGDVVRWQADAARAGVAFDVGRRYHLDGDGVPYLRTGFASLAPDELARAVVRLAGAVPPPLG